MDKMDFSNALEQCELWNNQIMLKKINKPYKNILLCTNDDDKRQSRHNIFSSFFFVN